MDAPSLEKSLGIPEAFEERYGRNYTVKEKYFYLILRQLWNRKKSEDGWVLFNDFQKGRPEKGFKSYGLSARVCKSARRKLKADGLIETRYAHGENGYRKGTEYRLLDGKLRLDRKAIHQSIIGRLGGGNTDPEGKNGENQRVSWEIGVGDNAAGCSEPFAAQLC